MADRTIADLINSGTVFRNDLLGYWANEIGLMKNVTKYDFLKGITATIVIAANDSSDDAKGNADIVCTGNHDQVLIQQAIDYANTNGAFILLRKGNYIITDRVIMKNRALISGESWETVLKGVGTTAFSVFDYDHPFGSPGSVTKDTPITDFHLRLMKIDCSGMSVPNYAANFGVLTKGVFGKYFLRSSFDFLWLKDTFASSLGIDFLVDSWVTHNLIDRGGRGVVNPATDQGGSGIGIGTGGYAIENLVVAHNHVKNCGKYGIFFEAQNSVTESKKMFCHDNFVYGNRYGLGTRGVTEVSFQDNWSFNNTEDGLLIDKSPFSTFASRRTTVRGNHFIGNGTYGIRAINTHNDSVIEHNEIRDNVSGPISVSASSSCIIRDNVGYNPVSGGVGAQTPGASPWTYTAGNTPETLYLTGDDITNVTKGGVSLGAPKTIVLEPNQAVTITYTGTLTAVREKR